MMVNRCKGICFICPQANLKYKCLRMAQRLIIIQHHLTVSMAVKVRVSPATTTKKIRLFDIQEAGLGRITSSVFVRRKVHRGETVIGGGET